MFNEKSRCLSPVTRPRVSFKQLQALVSFLEKHPQLAKGDIGSGMEGRRYANRGWQAAAQVVNAVELTNHKSAGNWSRYWSTYKSKLKGRLKNRGSADLRGSGSSRVNLSEMDQRVLTLLGPAFASHPGVRVEVHPDIPDLAVQKIDPTEDEADSGSGTSVEEPAYATVRVIASNDTHNGNSEESKNLNSKATMILVRNGVSKALRPPATAQPRSRNRIRPEGGETSKIILETLRSRRIYERAVHKLTLHHMEEKRREEKEIFELKKKKLLLEISSLANKTIITLR